MGGSDRPRKAPPSFPPSPGGPPGPLPPRPAQVFLYAIVHRRGRILLEESRRAEAPEVRLPATPWREEISPRETICEYLAAGLDVHIIRTRLVYLLERAEGPGTLGLIFLVTVVGGIADGQVRRDESGMVYRWATLDSRRTPSFHPTTLSGRVLQDLPRRFPRFHYLAGDGGLAESRE
jgi:hypothetical protein